MIKAMGVKIAGTVAHVLEGDFSDLKGIMSERQFKHKRHQYVKLMLDKHFVNEYEWDIRNRTIEYGGVRLMYSSSYSGYRMAIVISEHRCGLDLECYVKLAAADRKLFISEREWTAAQAMLGELPEVWVKTFLWCCKESLGKLFGVGLRLGYRSFEWVRPGLMLAKVSGPITEHTYDLMYRFDDNCCMVISCKQLRQERDEDSERERSASPSGAIPVY